MKYLRAFLDKHRLDASKLIADGSTGHLVGCPVCGRDEFNTAVHPTLVEVNAGGSITTVDHEGTRVASGLPSGRGVSIRLGFTCEQGHGFVASLQFHKGTTSIEAREDDAIPERTIWRD